MGIHLRVKTRASVIRGGAIIMTAFILAVLLQAGCAGLGKRLEAPDINVVRIQFQEVRALESIFQIQLRVFNTNEIPVKIRGMSCELEMNGKRFASGVSNNEVEIPAYGHDLVTVHVYSSFLDVFKGVLGLKDAEKLRYQIKGKVRLEAGTLVPSVVPFRSEGELSLDNLAH